MELNYISDQPLQSISKIRFSTCLPIFTIPHNRAFFRLQTRRRVAGVRVFAIGPAATLEQPGGKMVVELVGAFNELTERMNINVLSTSSSRLLFKSLKLTIPILQTLPVSPDGRSPLSKALSVAVILADLQVQFHSLCPKFSCVHFALFHKKRIKIIIIIIHFLELKMFLISS